MNTTQIDLSIISTNDLLKLKKEKESTIASLNNKQMSYKILINSLYGACGSQYFRYYDLRIAEGITISGQLSIRWIAERLNKFLNKITGEEKDRIVLIDTDSVVLTLADIIDKHYSNKTIEQTIQFMDKFAEDKIQPFIDKSYQELADYMNAYEQKMKMKRENLADVMVSVSKKRYCMSVYNSEGVQYKEPQLKIMGLQMVKSSTPAIIRKKLKESLKPILYGVEADIQKYCGDIKKEFYTLKPEEIAFPRGISDVDKYYDSGTIYKKSTPIHVRGALLYNYYVKQNGLTKKYPLIQEGDKIKFIYLKKPNPIFEDCISFIDEIPEEFMLTEYVDYDKMYEKTFEDAVQNILDALDWSTQPKATLEDWFL